jgi:hypothetical protein
VHLCVLCGDESAVDVFTNLNLTTKNTKDTRLENFGSIFVVLRVLCGEREL